MNSLCAVTIPAVQMNFAFPTVKCIAGRSLLHAYALRWCYASDWFAQETVRWCCASDPNRWTPKTLEALVRRCYASDWLGLEVLENTFFFFLLAPFTHSSFLLLNAFIIACTNFQLVSSKMQLCSFGEITFADSWCAVFAVCCRPRSRIPLSKKKKECCLMGSRCKRLFHAGKAGRGVSRVVRRLKCLSTWLAQCLAVFCKSTRSPSSLHCTAYHLWGTHTHTHFVLYASSSGWTKCVNWPHMQVSVARLFKKVCSSATRRCPPAAAAAVVIHVIYYTPIPSVKCRHVTQRK